MAAITLRTTSHGRAPYDVRWRFDHEARLPADNLRPKVEGDDLAGVVVDPRAGDVTFADYATQWLELRLVRGQPLSLMTRRGYEGLLRRQLTPTFGSAKLRRISVEDIRRWYAQTTTVAGPDQAAKAYRLLRAIMSTAVEDDRIERNPCRVRGAGVEQAAERPMVTTVIVLDLADAIAPPLRAFVLLAGFGGLRTGELLGLRRQDADEIHGIVHVRRQVHEVTGKTRRDAGTSTRVVTGPKSQAGKREVAIPRAVMAILAEHLATHTRLEADAPIFASKAGKQPMRRATLSEAWRAAVAKVDGAPTGLRVHDLRHHAATSMARMPGITTRELMARIGHSSPRAALIYQHATAERDRAVAEYLDAQIAAIERPKEVTATSVGRWVAPGMRLAIGIGRQPPTTANEHESLEAAGRIELPYGALQAPA